MFKSLVRGFTKTVPFITPIKRNFAVLNYHFVANLNEEQIAVYYPFLPFLLTSP